MNTTLSLQTFTPLDNKSIIQRGIQGDDMKELLNELIDVIFMNLTPYIFGPSGSGKSHMAKLLAATYSDMLGVPAYYFQNSPEVTKTNIIGGMRLVEGTTRNVLGLIAKAMQEGAMVVFDEATHARDASSLTMLNSVLDEDHITAIGEQTVFGDPRFRMIIASNDDKHVGNIRLPQSFAQRLYNYKFDYPSFETEYNLASKMAKEKYEEGQINKRNVYASLNVPKNYLEKEYQVPEIVAKFITGYVRKVRSDKYPLSVRNMHKCLIRLQMLQARKTLKGNPFDPSSQPLDDNWTTQNQTAVTQRILDYCQENNVTTNRLQLISPEITIFKQYVSYIGLEEFISRILAEVGYDVPIDGLGIDQKNVKNELRVQLL